MALGVEEIESIARVCHELNRVYCGMLGDLTQPFWGDAPMWQRESVVAGVTARMNNPDAPASASHESWLARKKDEGWQYGKDKDAEHKTHPCMLPFDDLPREQQKKDELFCAVCKILLSP